MRRRGDRRRASYWHLAVLVLLALGVAQLVRSELQADRLNRVENVERKQAQSKRTFDSVVVVPIEDESHPPGSDPAIRSVQITSANKVEYAVDAGMRYWDRRDEHPCATPRVYRLERLLVRNDTGEIEQPAGMAQLGGCVIWLDRETRIWTTARQDCALLIHEMGHTASLTFDEHPPDDPYHSLTGLMSPSGDGVVPHVCRKEFDRGEY